MNNEKTPMDELNEALESVSEVTGRVSEMIEEEIHRRAPFVMLRKLQNVLLCVVRKHEGQVIKDIPEIMDVLKAVP